MLPHGLKAAFNARLPHPPKYDMDYFRCAYRSLAQGYKQAIEEIERNTGVTYKKLYIVGGGAKNHYLNKLTEPVSFQVADSSKGMLHPLCQLPGD